MTEIMSGDDAIDDLPDIGVMDCYVRSKLMRAAMDKYRNYPEGWENAEYKRIKNALMNYNKDGLRCEASVSPAMSGWVREIAADTRSEDFIVQVFDRITNDEWDREKCISVARDYLKDHLSGSMGMPDDTVIRENIKNYGDS